MQFLVDNCNRLLCCIVQVENLIEVNINQDINNERYEFLKWAEKSFDNYRAVPPATGIIHQVNIEFLSDVIIEKDGQLYPDSMFGTDSHTTMINGIGVLGWRMTTDRKSVV